MARSVEYYFSLSSPWAYIGHALFMEVVQRHGVEVVHKPVALGGVFAQTGGLPLPKRHPARQRYRMMELQRWRERRGLSFTLEPKHWPFDPTRADRAAIAIVAGRGDPDAYLRAVFKGVWEEERDLGDPIVLAELLEAGGYDSTTVLETADGTMTEALYALNLENAVSTGVIGSPGYVLDGEVFWGQDRLELLDDALASGRSAYRAAV